MIRTTLFFAFSFTVTIIYSQQVIPLYNGPAPGSANWNWEEKENTSGPVKIVYNVTRPTLTAYLPDSSNASGAAVIIAPGGAFHVLAIEHEGIQVAQWLAARGIAAFVLKYRLVQIKTDDFGKEIGEKMKDKARLDAEIAPIVPLAMHDGLTAIQYVRSHAADFGVNPDRIGMMGFSAGGTLTMSVVYNANESNRPNFVAPIYLYEHAIVGAQIPTAPTPIFIAFASDDDLGLASHSINIYSKWLAAGQPAELHAFEKGKHGFGMREQKIPTDFWTDRMEDWLKIHGYISQKAPFEIKTDINHLNYQKNTLKRMQNDWAYFQKYKADNQKVAPPTPNEHRVVFMGNSITEFWVKQSHEFFSQNNFIGRGISGQTTPQMVLRFRPDVIALQPEAVVINGGINDVAENTGPYNADETMGNIASMAELARANNIRVILASVHPAAAFPWRPEIKDVAEKIIDLNKRIKTYADQQGFIYLDYHTAMKNSQNGMNPDMAADGVHPTLAGYQVMEKLAQEAIKKALKK